MFQGYRCNSYCYNITPLGAFVNDYYCFKMGKYSIIVAQVVVGYYKNSQMCLLVYLVLLMTIEEIVFLQILLYRGVLDVC